MLRNTNFDHVMATNSEVRAAIDRTALAPQSMNQDECGHASEPASLWRFLVLGPVCKLRALGVGHKRPTRPTVFLVDDGVKAIEQQLDGRRCRSTLAASIVEARGQARKMGHGQWRESSTLQVPQMSRQICRRRLALVGLLSAGSLPPGQGQSGAPALRGRSALEQGESHRSRL